MLSRCGLQPCFAGFGRSVATTSARDIVCSAESSHRSRVRHIRRFSTSKRGYSTRTSNSNHSDSSSIFSRKESPWDHVFSDIRPKPTTEHTTKAPPAAGSGRRQAMTAREMSAFDEMFQMIFDAASTSPAPLRASTSGSNTGVGRGGISDLFGKLRKHSKRVRWTSEVDEILDRKKEEMDMCQSDYELLEWATREIFEESQKYEEAARKAVQEASTSEKQVDIPMLQPPAYPHLLAHLMRTFREKYNDPHLTLAMFNHARHLSIASYVFGCSTEAYNELIETRWKHFRDFKGVHDALEEMTVNGVDTDSRTRKLVETVRRDVGKRELSVEDLDLDSGEVLNMLSKMDKLVAKPTNRSSARKRSTPSPTPTKWDDWKASALEDKADDTWGFDQWEKTPSNKRSRQNTKRWPGSDDLGREVERARFIQ